MSDQTKSWRTRDLIGPVEDRAELDTADDESSLGSLDNDNQTGWAHGDQRDLEERGRGGDGMTRKTAKPAPRLMGMREVMVVSPFHQSQKETETQNDAYKNKL